MRAGLGPARGVRVEEALRYALVHERPRPPGVVADEDQLHAEGVRADVQEALGDVPRLDHRDPGKRQELTAQRLPFRAPITQ